MLEDWKTIWSTLLPIFQHQFYSITIWITIGRPIWLVVWNIFVFHILGIIIPIDYNIFQRGWNHQPAMLEDWLTISGNLPNVGLRIEKTRLGWWDPIIPIGHPIIGGHEKISSTRGNKNKDFLRKNQVFLLDWPAGSASVSIWKITLVPADRGSIFTQLCWTCWRYPLVMTNIAMGNGPFIDGLPIKNGDSPVVGMIQCDFHIFQGGWNHQPV